MSKLNTLIVVGLSAVFNVPTSYAKPPLIVTVTDLGVGPGGTTAVAQAINRSGLVIGYGDGSNPAIQYSIIWNRGVAVDLPLPYATDTWSEVLGFNDSGQIVGGSAVNGNFDFDPTAPPPHPVIWEDYNVNVLALPSGASTGFAWAINKKGLIAGNAGVLALPSAISHVVTWTKDFPAYLGTLPGNTYEVPYAMNAKGTIVGKSGNFATTTYAALWANGVATNLGGLPGGTFSETHSINDGGQVVGFGDVPIGCCHAILWTGNAMTDLGTLPGGTYSVPATYWSQLARDQNSTGQIVGEADASDGNAHAVTWLKGVIKDLGTLPNGTNSTAAGINENGWIVGRSDGTASVSGYHHAVLWACGRIIDLGTLPGGSYSNAYAINDDGEIVGYGDSVGPGGVAHALMWDTKLLKCK